MPTYHNVLGFNPNPTYEFASIFQITFSKSDFFRNSIFYFGYPVRILEIRKMLCQEKLRQGIFTETLLLKKRVVFN